MNLRPASVLAVLVAIVTGHEEAALAQYGGVLEFDGTDDHVTVPYDDSWDLAWQLYLEPDGSLRLMVEDSSVPRLGTSHQQTETLPAGACSAKCTTSPADREEAAARSCDRILSGGLLPSQINEEGVHNFYHPWRRSTCRCWGFVVYPG